MPPSEAVIEMDAADLPMPPIGGADVDAAEIDKPPSAPAKPEREAARAERAAVRAADREARREPGAREIRREDEDQALNILEWMRGLGTGKQFRVDLSRVDPSTYDGHKTSGFLKSYHSEHIDEERVQREFGGGRFHIKVQVPRGDGTDSMKIFRARSFEIAGAPKVSAMPSFVSPGAAAADVSEGLGKAALTLVGDMVRQDRSRPTSGDGDAMTRALEYAVGPFKAMVERQAAELVSLREALMKPPPAPDGASSKLLERMIDSGDGRLTAIRTQHDSELRQLRDNFAATESRLRDQFDRDLKRLEIIHDREVQGLKDAHAREFQTMKDSYERERSSSSTLGATKDTVKDFEIKRLTEAATRLEAEVRELRAKKDKSAIEVIKEGQELKKLLGVDEDGGGDDDKSGWEKFLEVITNSETAVTVAKRWATKDKSEGDGGGAGKKQIEAGKPYRAADGQVYVNDADGTPHLRRKKPKPADPAAAAAPDAQPDVDPAQLKLAVSFLETACRTDKDADEVALSIKGSGMMPASILSYLGTHSVDDLLDKVAGLEASSPLKTQKGRNWARKVAKALVG